jgi:hypothetical protein
VALLPLADGQAAQLLASVPAEKRSESWWLVLRDRNPVAGNQGAGVLLLAEMRLTRPLGHVFRVLQLSGLLDALDNLATRYRTRLGRFVPDGAAPRRYP